MNALRDLTGAPTLTIKIKEEQKQLWQMME